MPSSRCFGASVCEATMIQLMAGVMSAGEAELALAHGADIIDVMRDGEPAETSPDGTTLDAVITAVAGRQPVSASVSAMAAEPAKLANRVSRLAQAGAQYVKIELSGPNREFLVRSLAPLAARVSFIGVICAEGPAEVDTVPVLAQAMAESGFAGAILDNASGAAGRLMDRLELSAIRRFIDAMHLHNMLAGIAGSLEAPDIPRLAPLVPDILAFRRALCAPQARGGEAGGRLDAKSLDFVRALINESARAVPAREQHSAADDPAPAPVAHADLVATDRVFVHDFVLPVRIGAYGREHHEPQRVRFNVDVLVRRAGKAVEDMRDVFSYDVITDGIRMLVGEQHIRFVETLAERISALLLAHPRVVSTTVRIEKLDIGPGAVGVEIVRRR